MNVFPGMLELACKGKEGAIDSNRWTSSALVARSWLPLVWRKRICGTVSPVLVMSLPFSIL